MLNQVFKKLLSRASAKKQDGVTLLLAILILSAIMAISFSVATILFIEVRNSSDLLKTEAALYGAQGLSEEVTFAIKRKVPNASNYYMTQLNGGNVILTSSSTSLSDTEYRAKVSLTANNFGSTPNIYVLASTTNPYGGSGYGRIRLSYLDTGNSYSDMLYVYLCQYYSSAIIDPSQPEYAGGEGGTIYNNPPCSDPAGHIYWLTGNYTSGRSSLSNNSSLEWFLDPNMLQELKLVNTTGKDIYVLLETFGPPPAFVPKGIPYFDRTIVDINAASAAVNRRVRASVPNSSAISGYGGPVNYAAAANGGVASASSEYNSVNYYPAAAAINGDRKGVGWGQPAGTGGWNNADSDPWPNWLQVVFSGPKNISEIDVYTLADAYPLASDPGPADTFTLYGITNFQVQYDNGSGWQNVPGGAITGNNLVWRKISFPTISNVTKIRVLVSQGLAGYSRIVELEAY